MTELRFSVGEVEAASAVLTATARALFERGNPLWPLESLTPPRLLRHYPQESWRVAWRDGETVAAFALLDSDPLFWPEDAPAQALYLHKLGVVPGCQGQGLAQAILRQAVQETRARQIPWLKLDTASDRRKLRDLYTGFGFTEVGERQVGPYLVTLLELSVTS